MINGMACPCTKCMPCRFNRRRTWTHRMLLETMKHEHSTFLTLTYDDVYLPSGGTLVPRDVQLFIKRLRKAIYPIQIRYFFVGEYGDQTNRPHYHAALFGIHAGFTEIVKKAWPYGHVMLGDLNSHSAQYIAGYTVKKMTAKDDTRLNGRYPEFARMSLRPGIGALAVDDISKALSNKFGKTLIDIEGDVPKSLKMGSKSMPLARYIRRKIRERLGIYDPQTGEIGATPQGVLSAYKEELQNLYQNSIGYQKNLSKQEVILETFKQKRLNFETKTKIYNSKTRKVI
ncbi:MAG: replication initiator protein [Arizlama microvirus]|nr:MAG: replication initiator protein [Arizlama microvirus]